MAEKTHLSRRESQVMEVLYRRGCATARDVWSALGESRTYSTVRKILSILEEKGQVTHRSKGNVFVYAPRESREQAATSALDRLVDTFFQGSVEGAVSSLLGRNGDRLSTEELNRIEQLVETARQETASKGSES